MTKIIGMRYTILLVCLIASSIAINTLPSQRVFGKLLQEPSQLSNIRQVQQYQTYNTNHYQQTSVTINTGGDITSARDDNKIQCSLNGSDTPTCKSHLVLITLISNVTNSVVPTKLCGPAAAGTPLTKMNVTSHLLDFVIGYEGKAGNLPPGTGPSRSLTGDIYGLYNDNQDNCTDGIGHLVHGGGTCTSKDVALHKTTFPNGETFLDALLQLDEDLRHVENDVNDNVKVHLTQQQFDALVDFTFNEGVDNLKKSKLLKDINEGNCDATTIASDLQAFTEGGLLQDRRHSEADLFNHGVYTG